MQAHPWPTAPKLLQTQALRILTQEQTCELDMGSHLGLARRCDNGKMSVPFLITAMESGEATVQ